MFLAFLLVRSALFTLFVPLDLWITTKLMSFYGVTAIANQELLSFFLSPVGFLLSLWFVSQLSFAFFVEQSVISIMLAQHDLGKRSVVDTLGLIAQRSWRVARVVLAQSLGVSVLLAALVWCGRWIYGLMLNDWDINYYLANQMSSVWLSILLLFLITLPAAIFVVRYWANWWLALPLSLFQNCSQWDLFRQARRLSQGIYRHIVIGHFIWLFVRVAIAAMLAWGFLFLLGPILNWATSDEERYLWLIFAGVLLTVVTFVLSFIDRLIYGACQYYVLRLQTKRLKLVNNQQRMLGLQQTTRHRKLFITLTLILIGFTLFNGFTDIKNFVQHLQTNTSGYVVTHRGGGFAHTENSKEGVEYSIELEVRSAEIDVQLTQDNQIVVFHDRDLGRMLGSPLVVEEATYDAIVKTYRKAGMTPPPLLQDLLYRYAEEIEFNIELKRYNTNTQLASTLADLLVQYDHAMVVSSLDVELLSAFIKAVQPAKPTNIRLALIYAASVGEAKIERDVDILMVSDQWLTPWRIIEIQQRGQEILAWTINSRPAMERLLLLGVDGIITDEPSLAKQVKADLEQMDFSDRALLTLRYWLSI